MVLIGDAYWQPLREMLEEMAVAGAIARDDLRLLLITDDLDEAVAYIQRYAVDAFGLRPRAPQPWTVLGERRRVGAISS